MRLPVGGVLQEVMVEMIVAVDSIFRIKNFTFELSGSAYTSKVDAKIENDKLFVSIQTDNTKDTRTITLTDDIYLPSALTYIAAMINLVKNNTAYRLSTHSP
jgi:hypothetical protein